MRGKRRNWRRFRSKASHWRRSFCLTVFGEQAKETIMALTDVYSLGANTTFQQRAMAAILDYILNTIYVECAYDIQTITVTGSPTAGNFVLTGGPLGQGTITIPYNATPAQVQVMVNSIFT